MARVFNGLLWGMMGLFFLGLFGVAFWFSSAPVVIHHHLDLLLAADALMVGLLVAGLMVLLLSWIWPSLAVEPLLFLVVIGMGVLLLVRPALLAWWLAHGHNLAVPMFRGFIVLVVAGIAVLPILSWLGRFL